MKFRAYAVMGAVSVLSAGVSQEAQAQAESGLSEITVTARRSEESILKVPVTVTAVTSEAIAARGITSLNDLTSFTPSLQLNNAGGTTMGRGRQSLVVRGITGVPVFIDGAPAGVGLVEGLEDLDRVEVLKGPQAAYFGRSTFSGAVNLVSRLPDMQDFKGHVSGLFAAYNTHDVRASAEGPLVTDKLSGRISVRDYEKGGQYRNYGIAPKRLGDESTKSVNGTLLYKPTDNLSIKLFGVLWHNDDGPAPQAQYRRADYNCNANVANPAGPFNYICGTLKDFPENRLGADQVIDKLITDTLLNNSLGILNPIRGNNYPYIDHLGFVSTAYHANLSINYTIPWLNATLSSLTATNQNDRSQISDYDGISTNIPNPNYGIRPNTEPFINWLFFAQSRDDDWSQEFRLTSDREKRFRWAVGTSYVQRLAQYSSNANAPSGTQLFTNGEPTMVETTGAFFGLSYDFLESLTLDLEGRYQVDNVQLFSRTSTGVVTPRVSNKFKKFVPRVNLTWNKDPRTMFYASYATGVNPGNFNVRLLTAFPFQLAAFAGQGIGLVVKPEQIDNFELGYKGRFWDNRVQLMASVYYAKWTDQIVTQRVFVPGATVTGQPTGDFALVSLSTNVGRTDIRGFELEGNAAVTEKVTLNFTAAMNDSEVKNYPCQDCVGTLGSTDVNGNELPLYPKWTASLGATYASTFSSGLGWYTRGDYVYRGGQWDSFSNLAKTPVVNLANFRAGIKGDAYSFEAFITNAFENRSVTSPENNIDVLSPGFSDRIINAAMPDKRVYGVRATYDF